MGGRIVHILFAGVRIALILCVEDRIDHILFVGDRIDHILCVGTGMDHNHEVITCVIVAWNDEYIHHSLVLTL